MKIHIAVDSGSNYRIHTIENSSGKAELDMNVSDYSVLRDDEKISYSVIPLSICTDERDYCDDNNLDVNEMVEYLENAGIPSHSACAGTKEWTSRFAGNRHVIAITLTGALSGCYNACRLAAEEYMEENEGCKVFAFDTQYIGPVQKLCVEFIRERFNSLCAEYGMIDGKFISPNDHLNRAESVTKNDYLNREDVIFDRLCDALTTYCREHLSIGFCLKSFTNLANNGRVNKAVAKISKTLKILIAGDFDEGELRPKDKVRGENKAVEAMYRNMRKSGYCGGKVRIDHCYAKKMAQQLESIIRKDYPDADIIIKATTGICSFYAERGGLVFGYETD